MPSDQTTAPRKYHFPTDMRAQAHDRKIEAESLKGSEREWALSQAAFFERCAEEWEMNNGK